MAESNNDCIFCKIVKGEIPSTKTYDSDNFIGILDINPKAEGHTLVVAKKHFKDILEMPSSLACEMMDAVKEIGLKLIKQGKANASSLSSDNEDKASSLSSDNEVQGFNTIINTNEAAGQVVHHVHVHIIPRKKGDGLKMLV